MKEIFPSGESDGELVLTAKTWLFSFCRKFYQVVRVMVMAARQQHGS